MRVVLKRNKHEKKKVKLEKRLIKVKGSDLATNGITNTKTVEVFNKRYNAFLNKFNNCSSYLNTLCNDYYYTYLFNKMFKCKRNFIFDKVKRLDINGFIEEVGSLINEPIKEADDYAKVAYTIKCLLKLFVNLYENGYGDFPLVQLKAYLDTMCNIKGVRERIKSINYFPTKMFMIKNGMYKELKDLDLTDDDKAARIFIEIYKGRFITINYKQLKKFNKIDKLSVESYLIINPDYHGWGMNHFSDDVSDIKDEIDNDEYCSNMVFPIPEFVASDTKSIMSELFEYEFDYRGQDLITNVTQDCQFIINDKVKVLYKNGSTAEIDYEDFIEEYIPQLRL